MDSAAASRCRDRGLNPFLPYSSVVPQVRYWESASFGLRCRKASTYKLIEPFAALPGAGVMEQAGKSPTSSSGLFDTRCTRKAEK